MACAVTSSRLSKNVSSRTNPAASSNAASKLAQSADSPPTSVLSTSNTIILLPYAQAQRPPPETPGDCNCRVEILAHRPPAQSRFGIGIRCSALGVRPTHVQNMLRLEVSLQWPVEYKESRFSAI